jgi:glycosyltransferase involved in cell wall biosynthesis
VVARSTNAREPVDLVSTLNERSIAFLTQADVLLFSLNGVEVRAVSEDIAPAVTNSFAEFAPDWIFVSSEDFGHHLLRTALALDASRVVLITHSTHDLPFGSAAFRPSKRGRELIERVRGVMVPSRFVRDYIKEYTERKAAVIRFPFWRSGPYPRFARFDSGFVTMINPCAVKGISLFTELARKFAETQFAAVPSWGTTQEDRARLQQLPNMTILEPSENVEDIYSRTKILLAPSLWDEAFGIVAVEAMLYGIPVVASDSGGLPEAKLGVDYCIPVRRISIYTNQLDDRMLPVAAVPPQDETPWISALRTLLFDRATYTRISDHSLTASRAYVASALAEDVETFLSSI